MGRRSKKWCLSNGGAAHDELVKSKPNLVTKKCNKSFKKGTLVKTIEKKAVTVVPAPNAVSVTSVNKKKRRKNRRKKKPSGGKNACEQSLTKSESLQLQQPRTSVALDGKNRDGKKKENKKPLRAKVAENPPASKNTLEETSDSDLEPIHANWELPDDSSNSKENEGNSETHDEDDESDLDISLEDEDEEVNDSDIDEDGEGESEDSDDDAGLLAALAGDVEDSEMEVEGSINGAEMFGAVRTHDDDNEGELDGGSESERLDVSGKDSGKKTSLKSEKKYESVSKPQVFNAGNKVFSLSNKTEILGEILKRTRDLESRCLYLAPIPADCTVEKIKKFIPKVKCCQFFLRPKANTLRRFAFLEFEDMETANKERLSILGRLFGGQTVRAELRSSQASPEKTTLEDVNLNGLVVNGLSPSVTLEDLKQVFPTADSIRMPSSQGRINHGYAYLSYVSEAVALDAFSLRHNYRLKENPISVNFKLKSAHNDTGNQAKPQPSIAQRNMPIRSEGGPKGGQEAPTITSQRVGKVLIQQLSSGSNDGKSAVPCLKASDLTRKHLKKPSVKKDPDAAQSTVVTNTLSQLINQAKLKQTAQEAVSQSSSENEDDESYGGGNDGDDDDDDDDDGESDLDEEENGSDASVDMPAGDNSEGEADDAALEAVLNARRTCAKSLRAPGAKRNWQASRGKKRAAVSMPKVIPVPTKRRK